MAAHGGAKRLYRLRTGKDVAASKAIALKDEISERKLRHDPGRKAAVAAAHLALAAAGR